MGLIAYQPAAHIGDQKARWTMSTSPTQNPVTGVVTFTARGTAALDQPRTWWPSATAPQRASRSSSSGC